MSKGKLSEHHAFILWTLKDGGEVDISDYQFGSSFIHCTDSLGRTRNISKIHVDGLIDRQLIVREAIRRRSALYITAAGHEALLTLPRPADGYLTPNEAARQKRNKQYESAWKAEKQAEARAQTLRIATAHLIDVACRLSRGDAGMDDLTTAVAAYEAAKLT